jgi:hypothetical protein
MQTFLSQTSCPWSPNHIIGARVLSRRNCTCFSCWTSIQVLYRSPRLVMNPSFVDSGAWHLRNVEASTRPSKISQRFGDDRRAIVTSIFHALSVVAAPCQSLAHCCWPHITAPSTQEYGIRGVLKALTRLSKLSTFVLGKSVHRVLLK